MTHAMHVMKILIILCRRVILFKNHIKIGWCDDDDRGFVQIFKYFFGLKRTFSPP